MPLKAIVDEKTVIASDLSDEEWADLQRRHTRGLKVRMACCGAPGHLRRATTGTRHFYHATGSGCRYAEESKEHLEIKERIFRICLAENWEAAVEFPSPDRTWISDVYATRDGRKVVFEVQISAITPAELEERDGKYRALGIESYWLLDTFLRRARDFTAWYDAFLAGEDGRPGETIPYIDPSLFATGPENHIFIPKGIRTAGLDARRRTLFTTNNKTIPLAAFVREVLQGNYRGYLERTAAAFQQRRRLVAMAAPALIRFQEFYRTLIRDGTCREKVRQLERRIAAGAAHRNDAALQKKFRNLSAEIAWVEQEYRSYVAESAGLFAWKKNPGSDRPHLYFRPDSEANVKKLRTCAATLARWEASFSVAISTLERELPMGKR